MNKLKNRNPNRLALSSSPYLKQHAGNPVNWYEWGEEALARAREENKPLIISIGYAACHWCHVMAHESFSDEDLADYMNHHFVCIKVDREERPDIDQVYMEAVQNITGRGGWPLNAFAFPDGRPFFGGTYFTKDQWSILLKQVVTLFDTRHAELEEHANSLTEALRVKPFDAGPGTLSSGLTKENYRSLLSDWEPFIDQQQGGFSGAPKFPLPIAWDFLLQYHHFTGNESVLHYVHTTLKSMAKGGIFDQAGGGFARYATDTHWHIPHFEKMLYDNAQLVSLYAHACQVSHQQEYDVVVNRTLDFVNRELKDASGGYYASIDADSEGQEGKYYTWTMKEFEETVGSRDLPLLRDYYQITREGSLDGRNVLFPVKSPEDFAGDNNLSPDEFRNLLNRANERLYKVRGQRVRPETDDKIITSWNGLMLNAFIDAFRTFGTESLLRSALQTAEFLEKNMMRKDGGLFRIYHHGKISVDGFLDDYAFVAKALTDLYEITFDLKWLQLAGRLVRYVLDHFADRDSPMFFYTSGLSDSLVARKYEIPDNVIPSSNSVMAHVLFKQGHICDKPDYIARAVEMLGCVLDRIASNGPYFANWAALLGLVAYKPHEVVVMGEQALEKGRLIRQRFLPAVFLQGGKTENLPLLKGKLAKNRTLIYVCYNNTCSLPVESVAAALEMVIARD
jgi:uncharacterized protein YyaL (SSP411 family)